MAQRQLTIAVFNQSTGWTLPDEIVAPLRSAAPPGMVVQAVSTREQLCSALPKTEYLVGFPLSESQFQQTAHSELRWIQLLGPQDEALAPIATAIKEDVRVTTAMTIRAPQTAEHAIALLLSLTRCVARATHMQAEHRWAMDALSANVRNLSESTVALLGAGVFAQEIAARLRPFGAEILALSPDGEVAGDANVFDNVFPPARLDELLSRADAVVLTGDALPEPLPVLRKATFAAMHPHAVLVDVGRSGAVDQNALLRSLQRRGIAAAALDIFATEPVPSESPLWTTPNLVVSPRLAAASPSYWHRAMRIVAENLTRIEAGQPLVDELAPSGEVGVDKRAVQ